MLSNFGSTLDPRTHLVNREDSRSTKKPVRTELVAQPTLPLLAKAWRRASMIRADGNQPAVVVGFSRLKVGASSAKALCNRFLQTNLLRCRRNRSTSVSARF